MSLLSLIQTSWRRWTEHRPGVLGINARNVELVRRHNRRKDMALADDKLRAKELLSAAGVPVPETLAVYDSFVDLRRLPADLEAHAELVVKPARGTQGKGILVLTGRTGSDAWSTPSGRELSLEELRSHCANILFGACSKGHADRVLLERRLHPHAGLASLAGGGLPDARVILLEGRPIAAMLRLPTREGGGRANLHQGAVGVGVDMASGLGLGGWWRGAPVTRHPDSGADLTDLNVPLWTETLDVARRAAAALPLGYLGVDVAVDESLGPVVLEVNARPGLEIQNVLGRGLRRAGEREESEPCAG